MEDVVRVEWHHRRRGEVAPVTRKHEWCAVDRDFQCDRTIGSTTYIDAKGPVSLYGTAGCLEIKAWSLAAECLLTQSHVVTW